MRELFKSLKKSVPSIIAIIILLVGQALCDLSLPQYTSNIINVGIQQGGIESATPQYVETNEMGKLLMLMSEENAETVKENYSIENSIDGETIENGAYVLNSEISEEKSDELDGIFAMPLIMKNAFENPEMFSNYMQDGDQNLTMQALPEGTDIFEVLEQSGEEQRTQMLSSVTEKFEGLDDSILQQMAISCVKSEYQTLGIDTDNIQSSFIVFTGLKMLLLAFAGTVFSIFITLLASRVGADSSRKLRSKVFGKVMSFSSEEMNKFSTASLITRCTNDIQQIQMMVTMMLRMAFYAPIIGIGAFLKVTGQNTGMSWVIGVGVSIILVIIVTLFVIAMPKFKVIQNSVDKLNLVSREILTGLPVIRAFSREKHEEKRFDMANMDLTKINLFVNRLMSMMMPTMMFLMNGISVLIVWVGAGRIDNGAMQVGDLMAFIQYTMQIIMAFLMISMMSIMIPRAIVSANRIQEVVNTSISIDNSKITNEKQFDNSKRGLIEFRNVSFKYPKAEEYSLKEVTFTARAGQTTAFIGSTGSGKSTLVNLIPRFYDVSDGELLIDGVNIKEVTQHKVRELIGYIPQKGMLFSGTINSNISYGNPNISKEDIERAAEISQSMEFISEKPKHFEEEIAQGGNNVSGGQKQRLSIARAIAKKPEIYIFDDSFSALDYKTDVKLRKALNDSTKDSTILIVAQRISTVLNAEQIVVMDNGKIAGIGTHKELMQSCEIYQQIASSQLSKEELENGR